MADESMTTVRFIETGAVGEVPTKHLEKWLARGYEVVPEGTVSDPNIPQRVKAIEDEITGRLTNAGIDARIASQVAPLVVEALQDDEVVQDAVALAADAELAGRDVIEGDDPRAARVFSTTDDVVWVVKDGGGRMSWLAVAGDGNAPSWVKQRIAAWASANMPDASVSRVKLGADVPLAAEAPAASGVAWSVKDAVGRIAEIAVGDDGNVPLWVLARWAARMIAAGYIVIPAATDPTKVLMPSRVFQVVGSLHQYRYDAVVRAKSKDHKVTATIANHTWADAAEGQFEAALKVKPVSAATRAATIQVRSRDYETVVATKTVSMIASAAPATAPRLCAIGDSITRPNTYNKKAMDLIGGTTVGTRTYDNTAFGEGRGGWALDGYFTNIGHEQWGDSPFLFPQGIAGNKFLGSVLQWKNVVSLDPNGYDWQGFQRAARTGFTAAGAYLYGANGYPLNPQVGDTVVDSSYAEADEFRQWDGSAWVAIARPAIEFSISKYIERWADVWSQLGGTPNVFSVMLNTNDFFNGAGDAALATWGARMDTLIASVRAWSPTVPIIPIIAPIGGPYPLWARTAGQNKDGFDYNIQRAADYMITKFDTDAMRTNKVFLSSFIGAVDEANMSDYVHPLNAGLDQMAPPLAGAVAYAMGA